MRHKVGYGMWTLPTGTSLQLDMVLYEHAVMKYGECRFSDDLFALENRSMENDIIPLPLAGLAAGID
jgi:hypothetical protein